MKYIIPPVGRFLLSAIFLKSAFDHIIGFAGTQQIMAQHGMPLAALLLVFSIILRIGGGLSVLLGFKAKWGAWALIVFLIPTTLIFHTKFSDPGQMSQLLKNLAILGGLLMVAHLGPGKVSLDSRLEQIEVDHVE